MCVEVPVLLFKSNSVNGGRKICLLWKSCLGLAPDVGSPVTLVKLLLRASVSTFFPCVQGSVKEHCLLGLSRAHEGCGIAELEDGGGQQTEEGQQHRHVITWPHVVSLCEVRVGRAPERRVSPQGIRR